MSNNNSTNRKHHNDKKIQQTSRITPKIREYLAELANERELELQRFMAFSSTSPASSVSVSVGAHSSDAMRCHSSSRSRSRSSSLGVATAACAAAMANIRKQRKCASPPKNVVDIPIEIESIDANCRRTTSASVEILCTPTKETQTQTPHMQTRKTQTPESALKSHKRLEWDPAADVGYRSGRAASVSNISTLERSVLEAVMQPAGQHAKGSGRPNHSESDLNRLQEQQRDQQQKHREQERERAQEEQEQQEQQRQLDQQQDQQRPPPLASSTFVNSSRVYSRPYKTPTPTSVASASSRRESCATSAVSSFDYHQNSRPSTAGTSHSNSTRHSLSAEELLRHVEQQRQEREYKAQLEQVLCNRRHVTRAQNKENQQPQRPKSSNSSSSSSCPPGKCDLDLGVDLLCSLVNKRSLSQVQKKQLIRDIAKRLACLDLEANTSCESSRNSRRSQHKQASLEKQPKDTLTHRQPLRRDISTSTSQINLQNLLSTVAPLAAATPMPSLAFEPAPEPPPAPVPVPAPRTRVATVALSPLPCSYASTSSAASNELLTQKTNVQAKAATTEKQSSEQAAMQEWLNPMTQSEIEYEEKRQQRKQMDTERRTQLDWIEMEILRLRTLQNLLTNAAKGIMDDSSPKSVSIPIQQLDADGNIVSHPGTKSLPSQPSSVPAPPAPPATPVSTPPAATGTTTAVVSAATRSSILRRDEGSAKAIPSPPTPPPMPPPPRKQAVSSRQVQRSKMATPAMSNSGSSESVCSFVQQRQRQFMAHYQNQQQQRLEQQQQQQQLLMRQQQQKQQQQQQQATCHMAPCPYHKQLQIQQQQQYMQMQYVPSAANVYGCVDDGAVYYHVVNSNGATCHIHHGAATVSATATATATTTSAKVAGTMNSCTTTSSRSSMLCISSEMSIPISLANACEATTTTTTTHQYDDVACHQQVQLRQRTSSSLNSQQQQQKQQQLSLVKQTQSQQMLQVRPRGIAYVIQFTSSGDDGEILQESLSLQDYLQRARPIFCAKSKQRKAILHQMQLLRNARRRELEELIENSSLETLEKRLQQLPPPVTSRVRIFSTREMKAMTSKRCESLPEVLKAQAKEKEERRRRSNRIMRDVFNRRLQRRVRSGKLSLNHSHTVI